MHRGDLLDIGDTRRPRSDARSKEGSVGRIRRCWLDHSECAADRSSERRSDRGRLACVSAARREDGGCPRSWMPAPMFAWHRTRPRPGSMLWPTGIGRSCLTSPRALIESIEDTLNHVVRCLPERTPSWCGKPRRGPSVFRRTPSEGCGGRTASPKSSRNRSAVFRIRGWRRSRRSAAAVGSSHPSADRPGRSPCGRPHRGQARRADRRVRVSFFGRRPRARRRA